MKIQKEAKRFPQWIDTVQKVNDPMAWYSPAIPLVDGKIIARESKKLEDMRFCGAVLCLRGSYSSKLRPYVSAAVCHSNMRVDKFGRAVLYGGIDDHTTIVLARDVMPLDSFLRKTERTEGGLYMYFKFYDEGRMEFRVSPDRRSKIDDIVVDIMRGQKRSRSAEYEFVTMSLLFSGIKKSFYKWRDHVKDALFGQEFFKGGK